MQHGRLVILPIPVVYQHPLDTISIRWTLNREIPLARHVRHRCSQLFHHLNAGWIASHGRLQTLNAEQEIVLQRQSFLEIFARTFQELDHILMKQCQSRILICLQFLQYATCLCAKLTGFCRAAVKLNRSYT